MQSDNWEAGEGAADGSDQYNVGKKESQRGDRRWMKENVRACAIRRTLLTN